MDEAGLPSRFRWLRKRDASKPHKYFIEILMACDSDTRFCWAFLVSEGTNKTVARVNRTAGQSKFVKVPYYQREYNSNDRTFQRKYGTAAGQMRYFARMLRAFDPELAKRVGHKAMVYRIFCDRRWDSLIGMYYAMIDFDVSYTSAVTKGARYHVAFQLPVPFHKTKKPRSERGKYKVATTKIGDVRLSTALWADSQLLACTSCDLGTSERRATRRQGRHQYDIACPEMMVVRGENFRAVDSHDQLRLGRLHFNCVCKNKPWPKVFWGLIEILLINIYIVARSCKPRLSQRQFRWALVDQLLAEADQLEGDDVAEQEEEIIAPRIVPRHRRFL